MSPEKLDALNVAVFSAGVLTIWTALLLWPAKSSRWLVLVVLAVAVFFGVIILRDLVGALLVPSC